MIIALSIFLYISGALSVFFLICDEPNVDPMPLLAIKLIVWPVAIWIAIAATIFREIRSRL